MLKNAGFYIIVLAGLLVLGAWGCTQNTDSDNSALSSNAGASGTVDANANTTANTTPAGGTGGVAPTVGNGGVTTSAGGATATGKGGTAANAVSQGGSGGSANNTQTAGKATKSDGGQGGKVASTAGKSGDAGTSEVKCEKAFQFTANAEGVGPKSLCDYCGNVLLIVNVAAECALTYHLGGLAQLQNDYGSKGFYVLGFWCDQFAGQMGDEAVREQVKAQYGVNFPLFDEINVNPPDEHPLYTWLKAESGEGNVAWNFVKFLIARDGSLIKRYLMTVTPEQVAADIEAAL